jgi:hypothetical protein
MARSLVCLAALVLRLNPREGASRMPAQPMASSSRSSAGATRNCCGLRAAAPLTLAVLALMAAACSGGAAPTGRPGVSPGSAVQTPSSGTGDRSAGLPMEPCSLLTDAEIVTATGFPVVSKKEGPQLGIFPAGCTWEIDSGQSVTFKVIVGALAPGGRSYYDKYFGPFGDTPISGIGDVALKRGKDGYMAVKGDTLIDLEYIAVTTHAPAAETLIKLVIGKL